MSVLEFVIGYDLEEFEEYYRGLTDLHTYYKTRRQREPGFNGLGDDERGHIESDPSHLIVWKDQDQIMGHAVWHETSTDEMTKGDPRSDDDRETLQRLRGGRRNNLAELHEVWLQAEHRRRGNGKRFFSFFEQFVRERDLDGIVYYSEDPAAIALCRQRGYGEGYLEREGWYVFVALFGT
ncbi:MAG: GNAT family N-acetyltransferase [Candidatus Thorarchaeota archaeon]